MYFTASGTRFLRLFFVIIESMFNNKNYGMKILQILTRVFVAPEDFTKTIEFYEGLTNTKCGLKVDYREMNLQLAQTGPFLIIAGAKEALEPFIGTAVTVLVDSIAGYYNYFREKGVEILQEPKAVPTGFNMRVLHPGGLPQKKLLQINYRLRAS